MGLTQRTSKLSPLSGRSSFDDLEQGVLYSWPSTETGREGAMCLERMVLGGMYDRQDGLKTDLHLEGATAVTNWFSPRLAGGVWISVMCGQAVRSGRAPWGLQALQGPCPPPAPVGHTAVPLWVTRQSRGVTELPQGTAHLVWCCQQPSGLVLGWQVGSGLRSKGARWAAVSRVGPRLCDLLLWDPPATLRGAAVSQLW